MGIEIERKFLIENLNFKKEAFEKTQIKQGFLNSAKQRVVRIRKTDTTAFITIKGVSNSNGTSRFEWEKEIPKIEAEALLELCEPDFIIKIRYYVTFENNVFEIDEFLGKNKGLIVAEIELKDENQSFKKPDWLGKEVTGDQKYYNSNLSKYPFSDW